MQYHSKYEHYRKKINKKRIFKDIIAVYLIAVIFVLFFNSTVLQAYKVPSDSMEPQINENTKILVNKYIYGPKYPFSGNRIFNGTNKIKRGDIIVFVSPEYIKKSGFFKVISSALYTLSFTIIELPQILGVDEADIYIKRVVGIPGDVIEYKLINGIVELYINNLPEKKIIDGDYDVLEETEVNTLLLSDMVLLNKYIVSEDEYYVLGDNRITAVDSRIWGGVKSEQIIGRAILKYFPFSRFGVIK